jgi:TonB family protein
MQQPIDDFKVTPKRGAWFTFLLSIVLHSMLLFVAIPILVPDSSKPAEKSLIEITDLREISHPQSPDKATPAPMIPPAKSQESQIAETEDAQNRKIDPKSTYLSDHNQFVEKQTKASRIDDFRSKQGTGAKGIPSQEQAIPPTAERSGTEETLSDEGELSEPKTNKKTGVKRNWKTLSLKDLSVGGDGGSQAATDDKLNVDRGERTLLSTREYKFFGYYQRIKDLLRQHWKPNIEHQMARIWGKGKQIRENEIVTKVLVLLDDSGKITKISKLASSGYVELDEAAVDAFNAAAPFPNPPKAMLDDDGFVRINWDFILTTESSPIITFRNVGSVPGY